MWTGLDDIPKNPGKSRGFLFCFLVDKCLIYPQWRGPKSVDNDVDIVDNHLLNQRFAHFYDISGTHSYQQVTVYTLFI